MNHEHDVEGFHLIAEFPIQDSFDPNKCRIFQDSLPIQTAIIQYFLTQFCGVITDEEQLSCIQMDPKLKHEFEKTRVTRRPYQPIPLLRSRLRKSSARSRIALMLASLKSIRRGTTPITAVLLPGC